MTFNYEPCENSWALREYEYHQDVLEQHWLDSLPEKRQEIIDYSQKALLGHICVEEYNWIFTKWTNSEDGYDKLAYVLDDWNEGNVSPEDEAFLQEVALIALEGAGEVLFSEDLYEICSEGGFSINKMVMEVIE